MKKAIIFGANGQDGYYLAELLRQSGVEVTGVSLGGDFLRIKLGSFEEVAGLIKERKPDYVFHLAAVSTTNHSAAMINHETIATGALNIMEAARIHSPHTRIFFPGSALQFENSGKPINESTPFEGTSIYAVSRIQTVYAARYYRSKGLKVYFGYLFNHDSPRRTTRHINKLIADTIKRIAGGSDEKLSIGDITVKKEFGFAGDTVKAIWKLVNQEKTYEAVIGTGKSHSIEEWIDLCCIPYGLNWKEFVVPIEGFIPEFKILVSDPSLMFSLGWRPEVDIEKLAKMMLD